MLALSIRQPWAWLIVNGYKSVENRTWLTKYRGDFLVHAAKGMTHLEYAGTLGLARSILGEAFKLPDFDELPRGGIVGAAKIIACIQKSSDPWFFGPYGFVLSGANEISFIPYSGKLGFFTIEEAA